MNVWITGELASLRRNYIAGWLHEHLEAAGHKVFMSTWDPADDERCPDWVTVLGSSRADLVVQADELRGAHACRRSPLAAAAINVGGTAVLAKACAEAAVPFAYLSTAEVTVGADLFALTKLAGEQAAQLLASKTGCQIIRLSGVYGPGIRGVLDDPTPNRFLRYALDDDDLTAHDEIRRSWTFVADAVRAIRLIVEDGRPGIWSVGRKDEEVTMFELASAAVRTVGSGREPAAAGWPPAAPTTRPLDTTALMSLGWEPKVSLEDGLRETAAWLDNV